MTPKTAKTGNGKAEYVLTVWESATYDVRGNARDGYEVNDVYRRRTPIEIQCKVETYNVNRARDGYPLGELTCVSHESLSPIRAKQTED